MTGGGSSRRDHSKKGKDRKIAEGGLPPETSFAHLAFCLIRRKGKRFTRHRTSVVDVESEETPLFRTRLQFQMPGLPHHCPSQRTALFELHF
jgi:hypothetical protein